MNAMDEERYKLSDIRSTKRFFLRLLSLAFIMLSLCAIAVFVSLRFPSFHHFCGSLLPLLRLEGNCHGERTTTAIVCNRCVVNYQHSANWSSLADVNIACAFL